MKTFELDQRDPGLYNAFINGNMDFWQRATTLNITTTALARVSDRHLVELGYAAAKNVTVNRSTNLPPALAFQSQFSHEIVINTGVASYGAAEFLSPFYHFVEGNVFQPLFGKDFTVAGYVFSTIAGAFPIAVRNGISTFSYVTTVPIIAGWNYVSAVIPWNSNITALGTTAAVQVLFGSSSGTTFHAPTLNAWNSGNFFSHSSATNFYLTAANTVRFAQIQVRSGQWSSEDMQNSFQRTGISFANELQLCQRYYEKSYNLGNNPGTVSSPDATTFFGVGSSNRPQLTIPFKTVKRVIPTLVYYNPRTGGTGSPIWDSNTANTDYAIASSSISENAFSISPSGVMPISAYAVVHWAADAEL